MVEEVGSCRGWHCGGIVLLLLGAVVRVIVQRELWRKVK